jgi:23S rRNA (cytosine1962-C5)-methyltransferase
MSLVEDGGLLVSCSCSHHVDLSAFREILAAAAARSKRNARLLEVRGQAPDHPVLLNFPEGEYLKAVFLSMD